MSSFSEIFKAYDIRGKVGSELNKTTVKDIARAFAGWLPKKGIVAIGRDMRPDSKELSDAFIAGLLEQGYDVWDIGLVTSDMIYFAVGEYKLAGGAVITASHNTSGENGIKLYRDEVNAVGLDAGLAEIRDLVIAKTFKEKSKKPGSKTSKNITDVWVEHCLSFVDNLKKFHIAIDAGNGMAGEILPHILPRLPMEVEELYFELDGTFPNHEANPQKIENLQDLIKKVVTNKLDLGIAFDGDGDRAVFIDDKGRLVLGTDLLSIIAKLYLEKYPGTKIVHDVRTSRATQELIKKWGGKPVRTKAGRVNIGSLMRKIGATVGGENTGHVFFVENFDADSGIITALVALQALTNSGKKLSELIDEYRLYAMLPEINIEAKINKKVVFKELSAVFSDAQQDYLDGLTISYPDRWFNIRASNTEPVMRLNAEADTKELLNKLIAQVQHIIKKL